MFLCFLTAKLRFIFPHFVRFFECPSICLFLFSLYVSLGFCKHESSDAHKRAMHEWKERTDRDAAGSSITQLVTQAEPEHRTWLLNVFTTIKFLVKNGLPLRGDVETTDFANENVSGGIFLSTFSDLLFVLNPELAGRSRL